MKRYLIPNESTSVNERLVALIVWIGVAMVGWETFRSPIFPSLLDIVRAYPKLWNRDGLGPALLTSLFTSVEALGLSLACALPVAYLYRTPAFTPWGIILSKLRFLSPSVFFLILLFISPSAHMIKLLMLAAGETFFLITSLIAVVNAIPQSQFDDARTLRMSEWEVTYYVVIRGTFADLLEIIRQTEAYAWPMLMMVEGLVRSEGGVGVLLLNQEKYMQFAPLYAIALSILIVGAVKDYLLVQARIALCPYSEMRR